LVIEGQYKRIILFPILIGFTRVIVL